MTTTAVATNEEPRNEDWQEDFRVAHAHGNVAVCVHQGTIQSITVSSFFGSNMTEVVTVLNLLFEEMLRRLHASVPLESVLRPYIGVEFEPSGLTDHADFRRATSVMDHLVKLIALRHLDDHVRRSIGIVTPAERLAFADFAPYCPKSCGVLMQRAGSCYACPSCGSTILW